MLDAGLRKQLNKKYSETGNERFGYISGKEIIEFENAHSQPQHFFEAKEEDLNRIEEDDKAWAIWHTQPGVTSQLSYEDYLGFLNFPEYRHIVIGSDGLRVYKVEDGSVFKDSIFIRKA